MTTEPIRPEVLAYLLEQRDRQLLESWPVQPSADLLPVLAARHLPPPVLPRREATLFTPDPVQEAAVVAQRDVAIGIKRLATGIGLAFGGFGVWLAGQGFHAFGTGLREAGAVSLWAVAAMFISTALARIFSPRRASSHHVSVRGNNNRVNVR